MTKHEVLLRYYNNPCQYFLQYLFSNCNITVTQAECLRPQSAYKLQIFISARDVFRCSHFSTLTALSKKSRKLLGASARNSRTSFKFSYQHARNSIKVKLSIIPLYTRISCLQYLFGNCNKTVTYPFNYVHIYNIGRKPKVFNQNSRLSTFNFKLNKKIAPTTVSANFKSN